MPLLKSERRQLLLSLLFSSCSLWINDSIFVDGFASPKTSNIAIITPTTTTTKIFHYHQNRCLSLRASSPYENEENDDGTIIRTRDDDEEDDERTLYDILGCSKEDSYERIRYKYSMLVKLTHPDAPTTKKLGPKATAENVATFSEVTSAWAILSDPVERKKYDRSLRQKEFEGMLKFAVGEVAIPFLKKTAETTIKVAEQTAETFSKTADSTIATIETKSNEMQEQRMKSKQQFEIARDKKRLWNKNKEFEQKAAKYLASAEKLQNEIDALPTKKIKILSEPKSVIITSSEALQILDEFSTEIKKCKNSEDEADVASTMTRNAIYDLGVAEDELEDSTVAEQNNEVDVETATKQMDQAVEAQKQAQKNLEEAQKMLMEAKKNVDSCRREQMAASSARTRAKAELKKKTTLVEFNSGKVKAELLREERKKFQIRTAFLNEQIAENKANAKLSLQQSIEYKGEAEKYTGKP